MGRRMRAGGSEPAWSSRMLRLDPLTLPAQFRAADANADGRVRLVELHRERVVLRRSVRGLRMAVSLPITAYRGIAMRFAPRESADAGTVAIVLEHRDPALSVPLFAATETSDLLAEWHLWGRILGLPLLAVKEDGTLHEAFPRLGGVRIAPTLPRRRRRGALRQRRPSVLMRRRPGRRGAVTVHREREIIARN
jgi:hypothetical protein